MVNGDGIIHAFAYIFDKTFTKPNPGKSCKNSSVPSFGQKYGTWEKVFTQKQSRRMSLTNRSNSGSNFPCLEKCHHLRECVHKFHCLLLHFTSATVQGSEQKRLWGESCGLCYLCRNIHRFWVSKKACSYVLIYCHQLLRNIPNRLPAFSLHSRINQSHNQSNIIDHFWLTSSNLFLYLLADSSQNIAVVDEGSYCMVWHLQ